MSRMRNRGANNPRRAARRDPEAGPARQGQRPGARNARSMGKSLGPQAQRAAKDAAQKAKAGDFEGAARIYRDIGKELEGQGEPAMASRAYLRAARALHRAGREDAADKAFDAALAQAQQAPNKKEAMVHFRDLVQRMRKNGNDEGADRLTARIKEAMGREKLGRRRGPREG